MVMEGIVLQPDMDNCISLNELNDITKSDNKTRNELYRDIQMFVLDVLKVFAKKTEAEHAVLYNKTREALLNLLVNVAKYKDKDLRKKCYLSESRESFIEVYELLKILYETHYEK